MGNISYKPLIESMTWSYSRLTSFESCPEAWFKNYIQHTPERSTFYASYGSYVHQILEDYYTGALSSEDMLAEFVSGFDRHVVGMRPAQSTVSKYVEGAIDYLKSFTPLPYNMLEVESKMSFELGGKPFVGIIDYLGERDGNLYLVDNKSGDISPRSNRKKPTIKDVELDEKLRQLYLYSTPVYEKYGKYPSYLCFNCFRTGKFICEPFVSSAYESAVDWALETIHLIENEEYFAADPEYFKCHWLCGYYDICEDYNSYLSERRRG